jgi:hypothetical protein
MRMSVGVCSSSRAAVASSTLAILMMPMIAAKMKVLMTTPMLMHFLWPLLTPLLAYMMTSKMLMQWLIWLCSRKAAE